MNNFVRTIVLLSLSACWLSPGLSAHGEELKMSIRVSTPDSTEALRLHVKLANPNELYDGDMCLNLGMMLDKGVTQVPNAIRLILTGGGETKELQIRDPEIEDSVHDYVVPLRAGSTHTLTFELRSFWCPKSKEQKLDLLPGIYTIRAEFTGKGPQHSDADLKEPRAAAFWTGTLESNVVRFQIPDEPMFKGRTVSSWVQDFAFGRFPDMDKHHAAVHALREIGAPATPILTKRLRPTAQTLDSIQDSHTLCAFEALGAIARPAIPDLVTLLGPAYDAARESNAKARLQDRKSTYAAMSLRAIGKDSIGPLIQALQSEDHRIRFGAAMAMEYFSKSATEVVPGLIKAMQDENYSVRWRAVRSLGVLAAMPDQSIPAIAERLHNDPKPNVRCYAASALRHFGEAAVPDLKLALSDPSSSVQANAVTSLKEIEAVAKKKEAK